MQVWTMDPKVYGLPDYGLVAGQSRTFSTGLGDRGLTQFSQYNLTAPIPVQLTYGWRGETLAQFRRAWESQDEIAFGSNWILITLPAEFARGDLGNQRYHAHVTTPFSVSLAGHDWWKVTLSLDVDASPALTTSIPPTTGDVPSAPTVAMWTLTSLELLPPQPPTSEMWTLEL